MSIKGKAAAVFIAASAVLPCVALAQHPRYRVEIIPRVPGVEVGHGHRAINDNGWVVGEFAAPTPADVYNYRSYLYRPGIGSIDLGAPPGLPCVLVTDVSNDGRVVGSASDAFISSGYNQHTWRWENGVFTVWPQMVAGRGTAPGRTNDSGRMVGSANDGSFIGQEAVEFLEDQTLSPIIPHVQGYNSAIDINNENQVLGNEINGVFVRDLDTGEHIILPSPPEPYVMFTAWAINDLGDVVGSARVAQHAEGSRAAVYINGQGWTLLPPRARRNIAVSINNQRQVVGNSRENAGAIGDHGWMWTQADGIVPLQDLIDDPAETYGVAGVSDINNHGMISAGVMHRGTGDGAAVVLVPIGTTPPCDSIDFNGDGLFPDNTDLEDFLSVFGGGPCTTGMCGDTDFNNDGLFPDNVDITAFFAVFGGGACP
ncbi:MAG TPA: hypothetical protein VD971_04160 [Phycisphaerales bacterium]|nr:hypothetical protein [Phycisphaerales bacterium]